MFPKHAIKKPLMYKILFQNTHQNCFFEMTGGYTTYPEEREVLLYDGLQFFVTKVEQVILDWPR